MISILTELKNELVAKISRTLEPESSEGKGSPSLQPEHSHLDTVMDDDGNWTTVFTSFFNKFMKKPLHPVNQRQENEYLREVPQMVGGVEVMPSTPPQQDVIKYPGSSPRSSVRKRKTYPVTPYPRGAALIMNSSGLLDEYLTPSRQAASKPVFDLDADSEDDTENDNRDFNGSARLYASDSKDVRILNRDSRLCMNNSSTINGRSANNNSFNSSLLKSSSKRHSNGVSKVDSLLSSQRVRLGGNDGLEDAGYLAEDMDGVLEDECEEVDVIAQVKSPRVSNFRFVPSITSTTDRTALRTSERKENKWRSNSNHRIPTVFRGNIGGGISKTYQQSSAQLFRDTRRQPGALTSVDRSRFLSRRPLSSRTLDVPRVVGGAGGGYAGSGSSAASSRVKSYVRMLGLSNKYRSTAQECYKSVDKQQYFELLRQTSNCNELGFSRSASILSTSSCISAPLSRTIMGAEWTRQRTQEIESKRKQKQEESGKDISLWTYDEQIKQNAKAGKQKLGESTLKSDASKSQAAQTGKNGGECSKKLADSDDDDDIVITKETVVRRTMRPNSLEQQARFSAFYKFTPGWVEDLKVRRIKKTTDMERQKKESELTMKMCLERRKSAPSVEDTVSLRFKMLDMKHPFARIEISEEDDLVELSPEMEKIITDSLRKHPPGEVLTEKFNIQITRRDIATLAGLNWLNDEVINFYMNLLMERSQNDNYLSLYAFNTFFYPKLIKMGFSGVKRWTKKVDVFSYDLLLIPVHLGMHWCLATIDVKNKLVCYYDSMLGSNNQCLQELQKYLKDEHLDKKKSPLDTSSWSCETLKEIPQQMNGSDCGMFACKFSEYLSRNRNISFTQDHMPYFRRRMVYEIVTNRLL